MHSTKDATVTFTAQWSAKSVSCAAGKYLEADTAACTECPANYYCPGGTFTYNGSDLGVNACSALANGFYPNSVAGSSAATDCRTGALSGKYVSAAKATSATNCAANTFKTSHSVAYGSTSSCDSCPANSSSAEGKSSCSCLWGYSVRGASSTTGTACTGNTIVIDYNENGGTAISDQTCTYGSTFTLPASWTSTKTGYHFTIVLADGTEVNPLSQIDCNKTTLGVYSGTTTAVSLKWAPNLYLVEFNANGGSGTMNSQYIEYDSSVLLRENLYTRTGYSFAGWATSADGAVVYSNKAKVQNLSTGETVTLYAKWTANTYTLTYSCGSGVGTPPASATATYDADFKPAANSCSRTGYTFAGWEVSGTSDVKTAGSAFAWKYTENKTFTATWAAKTYTVSFNANGGTGGQSSSVTATYDAKMPTIDTTKPTKMACKFMGWYDNATYTSGKQYYTAAGASARVWDKTANTTLYAGWNCFTVSADNKTDLVYTGSAQSCATTITVKGVDTYGTTYSTSGSGTYSAAIPTITDAGTMIVYYRVSSPDYTAYQGSYECTMKKAENPINLSLTSGTLTIPNSGTFTVNDAQGTLSVKSSDSSVATATVSGTTVTMTPLKGGSTTITVTAAGNSNYNSGSKTYKLTVNKKECPITLEPTSGSVTWSATNTVTDSFIVKNAQGTLSVKSSDTTVATVALADTTVTSTVVKPGSTTITVTSAETDQCLKAEATYPLTVNKANNPISLSATSGSMAYSTTSSFTVNNAQGALSVVSGTTSVATVAISGTKVTITSKASYGTSKITVTAAGNDYYKSGSKTYTVTVNKGIITLDNQGATTAGTAKIYQTYNTNVYLSNWGSAAMTTSANKITVPVKNGYTFGGYYDSTFATQYISDTGFITSAGLTAGKALKANGTWYAKWTANTITIDYVENGGATLANISCKYNESFTLSSTSRTGYTFSGWTIDGESMKAGVSYVCDYVNLGVYSGTAEANAIWKAKDIQITLDKNGGTGTCAGATGTTAGSLSCVYDGTCDLPAWNSSTCNITNSGKILVGWNTKADGTGTNYELGSSAKNIVAGGSIVLYAKWSACSSGYHVSNNQCVGNTITINYVEDGGDEVENITCVYGGNFKMSSTSRTGYTFSGWTIDGKALNAGVSYVCDYINLGVYSGTVDANAIWKEITYTVKYMDGDTELSGLTPTTYTIKSDVLTLLTPYKTGLQFVSWHTDKSLTSASAVSQIAAGSTGNKVFYVKWKDCTAGYACNGSSIVQCTGATYATAGSSSCSNCPTGYTYNTSKGKTSASQCQIRCAGGSFVYTAQQVCSSVSAGYYKGAHIVNYGSSSSRNSCSAGMTTIGYGTGADEAGDCGRILHVDGQKLYLRSVKKTDVSLHVKIGDTIFYGNMVVGSKKMSNDATKTLKIKHNGQTYSVYDDSVN